MRDGDKAALNYFDSSEIGDTDGDGMMEILDAWGTPIEFLRWAPGYVATPTAYVETMQVADWIVAPDHFDSGRGDPRWWPSNAAITPKPYSLFPLIVSAGNDKQIDIAMKLVDANLAAFRYVTTPTCVNDPYYSPSIAGQVPLGTPADKDNDGPGWLDNITNHAKNSR